MSKKIETKPVQHPETFISQDRMKYADGTDRIIYRAKDEEMLEVYNGSRRARIENNKKI